MSSLPSCAQWLARDGVVVTNTNNRRVLLIVADFPPRTSIGAARWEGFAPFLDGAGWEMDVVIEDPHDVSNPDWGRLAKLPPGLRVAACKRSRPEWYQSIRKLRGAPPVTVETAKASNSAVAVSESGGLRTVLREVMNHAVRASESRTLVDNLADTGSAIVDGRHKVVASSGPSHYVHVAASKISRKHNIPHIVDLRDPWARVTKSSAIDLVLADDELRSHEAETLSRAAMIITNTNAAAEVLGKRFPNLRDRIVCIPNGSDVVPVLAPDVWPSVFQIAHTGTLYLDRDPRPFMRAVARVKNKLQLDASKLRVVFMGPQARIGGRTLGELANDAGIGDLFEDRAPGPREAARQLIRDSVMAVAFQGETKTQIPAKVFEYVSFPLWMLALVGNDSATADLLQGSDALVFNIDDEESTARAIEACYEKFRAGDMPRPVGFDGRYSRQKQAERLISHLERLTA